MLQSLVNGVLHKAARHMHSKPFAMRNSGPLVSFTFDDVPHSAYSNGAAILEQAGLRGTFYIAAGLLGQADTHWRVIDGDGVRALYDRGHEIGCHTFSHIKVDLSDAATVDRECRQNLAALRDLRPGLELANFCYPFGRTSLQRKWQLESHFDSCRGIYEGVNAGTADLGMLRVIELYDRTLTKEKLDRVLRETRERNGWLIFYTHDVAATPSWIGCSPELLCRTIAAVQAAGIECQTLRDGLTAIGYERRGGTMLGSAVPGRSRRQEDAQYLG